ncbi:MAG: ammonia channel protein, partial [Tannerella sp.]|nr:ammonia channel protein [Tannerella sp.]
VFVHGLLEGNYQVFWAHILAVIIVSVYTFAMTYALYWITKKMIPMRVSEKSEKIGLDISQHDEYYGGIDNNRELAEYFEEPQ